MENQQFKPYPDDLHVKHIIKYRKLVTTHITPFQQKLDTQIFQEKNVDQGQVYLDKLNDVLIQILYDALDKSVGIKEHRNRNWNSFYTKNWEAGA